MFDILKEGKGKMIKYKKITISLFLAVLSIAIIISYFTLSRTPQLVSVSGILRDRNGAIVSNEIIKIGNEKLSTDSYGQFITHIKPNKKYSYVNKNIKFSLEYKQKLKNNNKNTDDNIIMTGGITGNNEFVTKDNSLMIAMKKDTIYIGSESNYSYSKDSKELYLNTNLDLKKSDKLVISPTLTSTGYTFEIQKVEGRGKYKKIKVNNIPVEDSLSKLEIHSNNNLTKNSSKNSSIFQPMSLSLKKEEEQSISLTKEIEFGEQDKDKISGNITPGITGTLKEDAVFDFINFQKSYIKITGEVGFHPTSEVNFRAAKAKGENKLFDIPIGTAVTHLLGKLEYHADLGGKYEFNYNYSPKWEFYWSPETDVKQSKINENVNEWEENISIDLNGEASVKLGPAITFADTDLFQLFVENRTEGKVSGSLKASSNSNVVSDANGNLKNSIIVGGEIPIANKFGVKAEYKLLNKELFNWTSSNDGEKENNSNSEVNIENAKGISDESAKKINDELAQWFSESSYGKGKVIAKKGLSWYHGAGSPSIIDIDTEDGKLLQGVWWIGGEKMSDITDEIASLAYPPKTRQQILDKIGSYKFSLLGISQEIKDDSSVYTTNGFSIYSLTDGETGIIEDEQAYIWDHVPLEAQSEANATAYFYQNNIKQSANIISVYPATNGIVYFSARNNYTESNSPKATRAPENVQEEYQNLIKKYK